MRPILLISGLLAGCTTFLPEAAFIEPTWRFESEGRNVALTAFDGAGPVLRLACLEEAPKLEITVFRFDLEPGNQVLVFGTADETYLFATSPAADAPGVRAAGPITAPPLTMLLSAGGVEAAYGEQRLPPLILPEGEVNTFAGACLGLI